MYYRVLVLLAVFWASAVWAGNNGGGAFTVWPDTGQSKCYDNSGEITCPAEGQDFYGQDAQYQGPARSYTKLDGSGNPLPENAASWVMVRDNVTGLIWEVKENGDGTEDYTNPHDADNTYAWCDTNPDTNGGNQGTCGEHDTEDFINALNGAGFGGHNDWRLPTVRELTALADLGRADPAIDINFFPNTGRLYWSATTFARGTDYALRTSFYRGNSGEISKSTKRLVRAVRGGSSSVPAFIDNGDGTVTDMATGLMWVQASADTDGDGTPDTMSWQDALAWCENLELASYSDWRLPDINELHSIVDHTRDIPTIDTTFFPHSGGLYWSATTSAVGTGSAAWRLDFSKGDIFSSGKSSDYRVRCVRGGQFGSFVFDTINDQRAGLPFQIRITARDTEGNIVSYYSSSVQITSDIGTVTPQDVTLVNGQAIVDVILVDSGQTRLYADDGMHPPGKSNLFRVSSFSWPMFMPAVTSGRP